MMATTSQKWKSLPKLCAKYLPSPGIPKWLQQFGWPIFVLILFFCWFMLSLAMIDNQLFWVNVRLDKAEAAIRHLERSNSNPTTMAQNNPTEATNSMMTTKQVPPLKANRRRKILLRPNRKIRSIDEEKDGKMKPQNEEMKGFSDGKESLEENREFIDLNPPIPSTQSKDSSEDQKVGKKASPWTSLSADQFELNIEVAKKMEENLRRFRRNSSFESPNDKKNRAAMDQFFASDKMHRNRNTAPPQLMVEPKKMESILMLGIFVILAILLAIGIWFGWRLFHNRRASRRYNCRSDTIVWITQPFEAIRTN